MKDGCCSITLGNVDVLTIHNGRCYARPEDRPKIATRKTAGQAYKWGKQLLVLEKILHAS